MISKFSARNRHESGFALLDVLMGMAIFALIAVIAVQSTSLMQAKAQLKGVAADAQGIAAGLESHMTENESYPLPATLTGATVVPNISFRGAAGAYPRTVTTSSPKDMKGLGVKLDPAHKVTRYWVDAASDGEPEASREYQFCVTHDSGVWVAWRSSDDRIFAHSTTPASGTWNLTSNPCAP